MEEETASRPKWLLELENRKRKVRQKIFMSNNISVKMFLLNLKREI